MNRGRLVCIAISLGLMAAASTQAQSDPKSQFVDALGRFGLALDGSYGDEGSRIFTLLDALEQGVARWDEAIRSYEAEAARNPPADPKLAALMHVGLSGLYLDRVRLADARRELSAAIALDPTRPDTFVLRGLAETALGDRAAATDSFRKAVDLDPADTTRTYLLARALAGAGRADDARVTFRAAIDNGERESLERVTTPARFMQFGIVAERTGVEPFFPPAIYADAFARLRRGDLAGAVAQLKSAAASDPLASDASRSYAVRRAADAFRDGDLARAVEQFSAAIELYPESSEPHRLVGLVYAADDRFSQSVVELRRAIALKPDDERSRLALADALDRSGDVPAAEQALREAIARIPASGRAHYRLARLYQRQSKLTEAYDEFVAAAGLGPLLGLNGIFQTMGAIAAARQNFDAAVDAYSRRVDLQPNAADAHQDLGDTYARLGRDDEALAEFAVAMLLDPQRAAAPAAVAQVRLRIGQYDRAIAAARRAVTLDPAHAQARYALATALLRVGKTDEGQKELETFQRLQTEAAAARARELELGGLRRDASVSSAAGDHQKAVTLLRRALEIAPDEMVSHLNLGMALMLAGQPAEAVDQFTSALALNGPDDVHQRLAEAYAALGRTDDSRREIDTYLELRRKRLQDAGAER